jgi:hypothetical protein
VSVPRQGSSQSPAPVTPTPVIPTKVGISRSASRAPAPGTTRTRFWSLDWVLNVLATAVAGLVGEIPTFDGMTGVGVRTGVGRPDSRLGVVGGPVGATTSPRAPRAGALTIWGRA